MAFALTTRARHLLFPTRRQAHSRRGRLRVMLRTAQLLPPTGLSTLGFDPARYQTEPPACYRASWQLPGRDSHPLATTSLCSDQVIDRTTSESLGTRRRMRKTLYEGGPFVELRRWLGGFTSLVFRVFEPGLVWFERCSSLPVLPTPTDPRGGRQRRQARTGVQHLAFPRWRGLPAASSKSSLGAESGQSGQVLATVAGGSVG